jgi:hypothetical protein
MPKPIFRASYQSTERQIKAKEDKDAFRQAEARSDLVPRPVMRRSEAGQRKFEFIHPEQNWIQNAAYGAAIMKPRPQVMNLIRDFRRVSYHYAKIQAGAHGWYNDPVYELIYHCLMERLEKARLYIEDPKSELRQLEDRALRKKWPLKIFLKRRAALEEEMSGRHAQLDLRLLMELMRKTQNFEQKKEIVQKEVRRLWQKAKKRRTAKKFFPKQNQQLQEQLHSIENQSAKMRVLMWIEWLDAQALQVIYDMEKDIVRMSAEGKILRDELPKDRRAIRSQTKLWQSQQVVIIADLDENSDPIKILAIVTPSEYSKKQRRRMRGKKEIYRNTRPSLQRKRFR